ncbi:MAG TPA: HD-GYP domain-containing protein, partial [Solirubrobacterales bacterium]|nr:HD-GYP domain-containing protein [Solirubrobacterales bacterium]
MERVPPTKNAGSFVLVTSLTALVLVVPCLAAIGLRASGLVTSTALLILIPVVVSVLFSHSIAEFWKRRRTGSPLLFEDLMLWGWLRRRRFEKLLARSEDFVGPEAGRGLSPERRARELERLAGALEARDPRTHGHSRRVARHATTIARSLKLETAEVARVRTAALLHDVGKIEVPWEILEKPGALTDEEFAEIRKHPVAGASLVEGMDDPELTAIVRHHHERIDGGGYPDGIVADEIPIGARIIAVADTFDALTSARSYRQPRSHEEALEVLREEAGTQLDSNAVEAFDGRYSSRRPVALVAAALGLGRLAGQSLVSFGTGASQVVAVGAAA